MGQRSGGHRWGHRLIVIALTGAVTIAALAAIVAIAPEVYSPTVAGATNVYTVTVSGTTGVCSGGWFTNSGLAVPPGVISTQITLIGGGGGGSVASGTKASGGVGGGGAALTASLPASSLPAGSVLYSDLGCGGGAGSVGPTGGAGGAGESDSGAGTNSPTGSGGAGGTAQGDNAGGGGGGGSALCVASSAASDCSGGTIIGVAGGGGGAAGAVSGGATPSAVTGSGGGQAAASATSNGGDGATVGCASAGGSGTCTGGAGGTNSTAGTGGAGAIAGPPAVGGAGGSAVAGGTGSSGALDAAGGGGGGGFFGGGAGATGQSGGTVTSVSGSGGGAASSYWNSAFGGAATFSNVATTGVNCGASSTQCANLATGNGSGGTAGNSGANGSLVLTFTLGGVAAASTFNTEPSASATSGAPFGTQPVVDVADYAAVAVGGDPIKLSIATHPAAGAGTLTCDSNPTSSDVSGVATFSGCSITGPVGPYTLSATDTANGAVVAASTAVTLTPGAPSQLAFVQGPTDAQSGVAVSPAMTVAVEDASGNVETGDNATQVGIALGANPNGGTLSGGAPVTVAGGVATFAGLSLDRAGAGYTVVASTTTLALADATSSPFSVSPGAPNRLIFVQGPSSIVAGSALSPAMTVAVEDANGNVETTDSSTQVSLAISNNPGGGALSGTASQTVVEGVAIFTGLTIDKAGPAYTLVASSAPSYTPATSSAFSVLPGAATQLVFVQPPANAVAGSAMTPAVTVAVEDAFGNVEAADSTTQIALGIGTNGGGGTLTGGGAVTVSSGLASFSGLSVDKAGVGYTLAATSGPGGLNVTSAPFAVAPGQGTQLVVVQQPSDTSAGSAMTPTLSVALEDAQGNIETGDATTQVTLAFGANPGNATLSGAVATVAGGIASFPTLSASSTGVGYTLVASTPSTPAVASATTSAFTVTPGTASRLTFIEQPTSATAGSTITPAVTVAVEDPYGNIETTNDTTAVSLSLVNPGGATLTGGQPVTVSGGLATFSGLSIDKAAGGYTLLASSNPSFTTATSTVFDVTPGLPTHLAFVQQPTTGAAGQAMTPGVAVAVEDALGNVETADNATQIALAFGANQAGGTLSGGTPHTVSGGIATFSALSVDKVGTAYTLVASSTGPFPVVTSAPFDIVPGPATKLAFVGQPGPVTAGSPVTPGVTVAVEDAQGNLETGDSTTQVTIALGANPGGGTLSGAAVAQTVSGGLTTFSGLSVDRAAAGYTLAATSSPFIAAGVSSPFTVTPAAPTQLAFLEQPSSTAAGTAMSPAVTVAVQDGFGNLETGDNATQVSLAFGTNPGTGTLSGGGAVGVAGGIATFSNLSVDLVGVGYTLVVTSPAGYTQSTSSAFSVTPGTANHLAFVKGPVHTVAGTSMPAVTVGVEDANGNVETADNSTVVSLAIGTNSYGATLSGGAGVLVSGGVATFSGLSVHTAGTGYTLVASSVPSTVPATSAQFDIVPGPAAQLAFTGQPTTTAADSVIAPAVTVAVEDAYGNIETADNATKVSLGLVTNTAGGTLGGGSATTVVAGVATFSDLSIRTVGTGYALGASTTSPDTPTTSATFAVTPGLATQLVFLGQPGTTAAGARMAPAVTVAIEDAYGNIETGDNATQVSLGIGSNPGGGTLSGGGPVTAANGIATFSNVSVNKTGAGYTLSASSTPAIDGPSAPFDITPGPATQLAFLQQPVTTVAGTIMTPAVTVAVKDANGNIETADNATQIAVAIGTNPGSGTLGGGSAVSVSSGVATFPGLSIDEVGSGYTLSATTSAPATGATSSTFDITGGQLGLSCSTSSTPATSCQNIDLPTVTLDGTTHTVAAPGNTLYVTDNRGLANVGWSVSAYLVPTPGNPNQACATVATFCNSTVGGSAANPGGEIPAPNLSVANVTCSAVSGTSNPDPQPGPGGSFPITTGAVSLCSAPAGHSAGTFKVGATYSLQVPAQVYAGQYQATVEYLAF